MPRRQQAAMRQERIAARQERNAIALMNQAEQRALALQVERNTIAVIRQEVTPTKSPFPSSPLDRQGGKGSIRAIEQDEQSAQTATASLHSPTVGEQALSPVTTIQTATPVIATSVSAMPPEHRTPPATPGVFA